MKCLIIYLVLTGTLLAQDTLRQDLAKAAAIPNSVERLAAYDEIATRYKLAPRSNVASTNSGNWQLRLAKSPIDDTQTVVGSLDADSSAKVGYSSITPTLTVRYKEKELDAYLNYDLFLGSDDVEVTLRFDKEEAFTQRWSVSTDGKAIFAPNSAKFVTKLKSAKSFVIRATPFGESPVTVSFTTEGVDAVINAINNAAHAK